MSLLHRGGISILTCAIILCVVLAPAAVFTQVPATISYQGYLSNSSGAAVNRTVPMDFVLYDAAADGTSVWSESHATVQVTNGVYNVQLGSVIPLDPADFSVPLYLEITIGGETMSVRQELTSVPYALSSIENDPT
jgi:hypothetical protein